MDLVYGFGWWAALFWIAAGIAPCLLVCIVACSRNGRRARQMDELLNAMPAFALPPLPRFDLPRREDPLEAIEGIGPEIADLLRAEGILTFDDLARLGPVHLRATVDALGAERVGAADPASWTFQASLLARGQFEAFADLVRTLEDGRVQLESICEPPGAWRPRRDGESRLLRAVRAAGVHSTVTLAQWREAEALARAAGVPVTRVHAWIAQANLFERGDPESYMGLIEPTIVARMSAVAAPYPFTNDYQALLDHRTAAYSRTVMGEFGVAMARWREAALLSLRRDANHACLPCWWIAGVGALAIASLIGLWFATVRTPPAPGEYVTRRGRHIPHLARASMPSLHGRRKLPGSRTTWRFP